MEDDCVNARGGTTTTDPPTDIKDGQEDHTEKDPCSSLQDTRGDRQEVRMISSCLDHLGDGMPHDRGTTESVGTMAHTNTTDDVITIGVKAGMMDKEDDGQTSEEGVMKDGSIDTDMCTRMDDQPPPSLGNGFWHHPGTSLRFETVTKNPSDRRL